MLLFLPETGSPSGLLHLQFIFKCQTKIHLGLDSVALFCWSRTERTRRQLENSSNSIMSSHFITFPERFHHNDLVLLHSRWEKGDKVQLRQNVFVLFFTGGDIYSDDSLYKSIKRKDDTFCLTFLKGKIQNQAVRLLLFIHFVPTFLLCIWWQAGWEHAVPSAQPRTGGTSPQTAAGSPQVLMMSARFSSCSPGVCRVLLGFSWMEDGWRKVWIEKLDTAVNHIFIVLLTCSLSEHRKSIKSRKQENRKWAFSEPSPSCGVTGCGSSSSSLMPNSWGWVS